MKCPNCGCDKDNHSTADPEDGTDERNYFHNLEPYTCGECCDCELMFDSDGNIQEVA